MEEGAKKAKDMLMGDTSFLSDMFDPNNIRIDMQENWIRVDNSTNIQNGAYLVTIIDNSGHRRTELATYSNRVWTINDKDKNELCYVVAYYNNKILDTFTPYQGDISKFKKGDIIVWTHSQYKDKTCWMLIKSFDYPSDRAARALIGRNWYSETGSVYGDWVPNSFGDDCHLATNEEKQKIYLDILVHFMNDYVIFKGTSMEKNLGYNMMNEILQDHIVILQTLKDLWEEYSDRIQETDK